MTEASQETMVAPRTSAPVSWLSRSTNTWQIVWSRSILRVMERRDFLLTGIAAGSLAPLLAARVSAAGAQQGAPDKVKDVQMLVFDTFGTVVDWRSAVIAEMEKLSKEKGFKVDSAAFADAWRGA